MRISTNKKNRYFYLHNPKTAVYLHRQISYRCFDKKMSHSIRVVQVILVHLVLVRIQVGQQQKEDKSSPLFVF